MAHQPMHINDWIEIDKEYKWYLDEKARVIREQGLSVVMLCSLCPSLRTLLLCAFAGSEVSFTLLQIRALRGSSQVKPPVFMHLIFV